MMVRAGDTLTNPLTGERVVARAVASETNGAYAEGDYFIPAGVSVPEHFHPGLEERLEIRAGRLRVWLGPEQRELGPGEWVVIPRGARHRWRNDGGEEVEVRGRFEPALRFEEAFESYFVIAALGGGQSQLVSFDLEPGEHALICFVTDREGGPPHVLQGMVSEAEVSG